MISPMEISERRFERASRGYRVEDVDAFLQELANSVASMIQSLEENENTIKNLTTKISEYEDDEESIKNALLIAQKQAKKTMNDAKADSENLVLEAKKHAEDVLASYKDQYSTELMKYDQLKKDISGFKTHLTQLYQQQLALIMDIPEYNDEEDYNNNEAQDDEYSSKFELNMHDDDSRIPDFSRFGLENGDDDSDNMQSFDDMTDDSHNDSTGYSYGEYASMYDSDNEDSNMFDNHNDNTDSDSQMNDNNYNNMTSAGNGDSQGYDVDNDADDDNSVNAEAKLNRTDNNDTTTQIDQTQENDDNLSVNQDLNNSANDYNNTQENNIPSEKKYHPSYAPNFNSSIDDKSFSYDNEQQDDSISVFDTNFVPDMNNNQNDDNPFSLGNQPLLNDDNPFGNDISSVNPFSIGNQPIKQSVSSNNQQSAHMSSISIDNKNMNAGNKQQAAPSYSSEPSTANPFATNQMSNNQQSGYQTSYVPAFDFNPEPPINNGNTDNRNANFNNNAVNSNYGGNGNNANTYSANRQPVYNFDNNVNNGNNDSYYNNKSNYNPNNFKK